MPTGIYFRKTTRKGWIRKLDKICGDIVKARDKKCVCCGSTQNLTPGHLFSRIAYSTRWDLENLFCQCVNCNFRHEVDPYPLMDVAEGILGKKAVEELHKRYVTPLKFKEYQLEEMYDYLKDVLDKGLYKV